MRSAGGGSYTLLDGRVPVRPVPQAIYATNAGSATSAVTASSALTAQSALTATSALTAQFATSAGTVPWTGVTSAPSGFVPPGSIVLGTSPSPPTGFSSAGQTIITSDYWRLRASVTVTRSFHAMAGVNGKLFLIGGSDFTTGDYLSSVEELDTATNLVTMRSSLTPARRDMSAVGLNGRVYVFGGATSTALLSDTNVFHPITNTWTSLAPMPNGNRGLTGAAALNGKIYVVGGINSTSPTNNYVPTVEQYDPATNTWTTKAPLNVPRGGAAVVALGNRLYVLGGGNGSSVTVIEEYDPDANVWSPVGMLPKNLVGSGPTCAAPHGDKVYVLICGTSLLTGEVSPIVEWDLFANTWTARAAMPIEFRFVFNAGTLDGKFYVSGVYETIGNARRLGPIQEYTPPTYLYAFSKD